MLTQGIDKMPLGITNVIKPWYIDTPYMPTHIWNAIYMIYCSKEYYTIKNSVSRNVYRVEDMKDQKCNAIKFVRCKSHLFKDLMLILCVKTHVFPISWKFYAQNLTTYCGKIMHEMANTIYFFKRNGISFKVPIQ